MTSKKPHILIVENAVGVTGSLKAIVRNAKDLADEFSFTFAIPTNSTNKAWLEAQGYTVYQLPFMELRKSVKVALQYYWRLRRTSMLLVKLCEQEGIDLIHINDLYNLSGTRAKKMNRNLKLVTHVRLLEKSMPSRLYQVWKKALKRHSDAVICVSNSCYDGFKDLGIAQMIHDRHPEDETQPAPAIRDAQNLRILYLGNYMNGKGHNIAFDAFSSIAETCPETELHFYGSDFQLQKNKDFRAHLEENVKAKKLQNRVFFNGPSDNIEELMKSFDIVLNCSEVESFSLVCQEALYYGVPLISTNSGGPADQIIDGENGFLIDSFDANEIGMKVEALCKDVELRKTFSENARKHVRLHFGKEKTSDKLGALYTQVLGS